MIAIFLQNLIDAKKEAVQNDGALLLLAMSSIQAIEKSMKTLHQTRSMVLRREALIDD